MRWFRWRQKKRPSKLELGPGHPPVVLSARVPPGEMLAAKTTLEELDPRNPPRTPTGLIRGSLQALPLLAERTRQLGEEIARLKVEIARLNDAVRRIQHEKELIEQWVRES